MSETEGDKNNPEVQGGGERQTPRTGDIRGGGGGSWDRLEGRRTNERERERGRREDRRVSDRDLVRSLSNSKSVESI